jgi:hypothetical protein
MPVYDANGNDLLGIVFDANGDRLLQAYDAEGNPLIAHSDSLVSNDDDSTGTDSGYYLTSYENGKTYVLRMVVDFFSDGGSSYQSFVYDRDNGLYYKFNASTTVKVYDSSMAKISTITMPSSAEHNNDGAYYNGNIYFPNLNSTNLYVWNVASNTVTSIPITGIVQPANGSTRNCDAICEVIPNSGKFYLVCRDVYTDDITHQTDDKMSVYEYDLTTHTATLIAEYPWDCVYVQGCTCYEGILYVACNTQTTGSASNYTGITVKAIRTDTWKLVDELKVSGNFEAEGMDTIPVDGGYEIMMGMGKYGSMSQAIRFTPPYKLVANDS